MFEMPALLSLSFDDAGTFARALTQADVTCTQTAAGPIKFDLDICASSRFEVHFTAMPVGSCVAVGKTSNSSKCFHIPLGQTSLITMLGREMDASSLAIYEGGGEHAVRAKGGASLAYIAASADFFHQSENYAECDIGRRITSTDIVSGDPARMAELRCCLEEVARFIKDTPSAITNYEVFRNIEQTLMTLLLQTSGCTGYRNAAIGRAPVSRCRILRKIEEILKEQACEPLYVTDLCAAAGVSQPTLYRIFFDVLDMNPKRYLQLRRLHLVRQRLLQDTDPARTVSSIAYDCGFWQLGRFGHAYRTHFGETPSQTLRRAKTSNIGERLAG